MVTAVFPASKEQVRHARHFAEAMLAGWPVADDTAMVVSELSANAAVHSASRDRGEFRVRLEAYPGDYVWVEVRDEGGPWIQRHESDGRPHGLDVVRLLAADFGVDGDAHAGWVVWARLDLPRAGAATQAGAPGKDQPAASEPGSVANGHAGWPGVADGNAASLRGGSPWRG